MDICSLAECGRPTATGKGDRCSRHHRRVGTHEPRLCVHCDKEFTYVVARGAQRRYCGYDCERAANNDRRRTARRAAWSEVRCQQCGSVVPDAASLKRAFCSKRCSSAWGREQEAAGHYGQCAEDGCERGVRAKGLCATHYNRTYHPGSQRRSPGDPERRRRQLRARTQLRRARTKAPEAEPVDRDVVGERDKWKCGICLRKVNRALAWPHPRSPSLDHVVPISQLGPHTYANCRISHLECNVARSNKGGGEQLLLFGEVA